MHFKPNKGDVVLDCGAYEGHFSIIASRLVGKKGLVYSFEPQDEMADIMSKKFSKYELSNIRDGSKTVGWVENFLIDQGFKSWTGFTAHLTTYGIKK